VEAVRRHAGPIETCATEMALHVLAHNLTRIMGIQLLMAAIRA
jgi:hypothetical protein